jgi:hypothetical protein
MAQGVGTGTSVVADVALVSTSAVVVGTLISVVVGSSVLRVSMGVSRVVVSAAVVVGLGIDAVLGVVSMNC